MARAPTPASLRIGGKSGASNSLILEHIDRLRINFLRYMIDSLQITSTQHALPCGDGTLARRAGSDVRRKQSRMFQRPESLRNLSSASEHRSIRIAVANTVITACHPQSSAL